MSEEDLMIQEKIKKREKTDIMLAYFMIVILLACILFVVYLKFIKKDNSTSNGETTEYTVNYIKLDNIVSSLNSNLSSNYSGINCTTGENNINIKYGDITFDIPLVNNELEFKINDDNKELSRDIYEEIVATICTFYSNDRDGCKNGAGEIEEGKSDTGYRFVNNTMYISTTSSISPLEIIEKTIYAVETVSDIDDIDYELQLNDKIINNIKVEMLDTKITVSGDISASGKVTVKLYDANSTLLESKEANNANNFSIGFDYSDKLKKDNIKKYSINIE